MPYGDGDIYDRIPPAERVGYGSSQDEIVSNYRNMHPECCIDLHDQYSLLTLIMECVVDAMAGHAYALKGGYVLRTLSRHARYTRDVDLSIPEAASFEILRKGFDRAGQLIVKAGADRYEIRELHPPHSGGLRILKDGSELVSADVSVQDLSYGIRLHDDRFYCYTFERMLLDKVKATLSPKVFRRVKDLFDIHLIVSNFVIDTQELKDRLQQEGIALTAENTPFNQDKLAMLKHAWGTFRVVAEDGISIRKKPEFNEIMETYLSLISEVFA